VERGREGGLYLDICAGVPQVPSYATADVGPERVLSQGPFEETDQ